PERLSDPAFVLGGPAPARLVGADRQRREEGLLLLPDPRREGVGNSPCKLGHGTDSSRSAGRGDRDFLPVSSACGARRPHPRVHPQWGRKRAPGVTLSRILWRVCDSSAPELILRHAWRQMMIGTVP